MSGFRSPFFPLALLLGVAFVTAGATSTVPTTAIYVELANPAPTVVARHEAAREGRAFDAAAHRAAVLAAQDGLLGQLAGAGVAYELTRTGVVSGNTVVQRPDRYTELINAFRIAVAAGDVGRVGALPGVRHVSVSEPRQITLDHSAAYIRANGPDSARSRGLRGTGRANCDGTASGQVIAVLDTGIDHTNPMFDSRFGDEQFEQRSADLRPVRLQGTPFLCDPAGNPLSHPKVVYRFLLAQAPAIGDDTGHGTNTASAAAGLKARADAVLNFAEVVEGIAPGALLMDYKVCPSLVCEDNQVLLALEDAVAERDLAGFPKPRATVVNMSFGSDSGDPESADAVAAGNLQFLNVVPVASAGNSGSTENTIGSPSAGRRVVSVAATNDPGVGQWSADVLASGERSGIPLFRMAGTPSPPPGGIAEQYVFVRNGQLLDEWPQSARGRIALVKSVDPRLPTSLFVQIANNAALAGAVAVLLQSGVTNPTAVTAPIPGANVMPEDANYLICVMQAATPPCADPANGTTSSFQLRVNPAGTLFVPSTAGFSSRGPNNDFGVVKPDVTAPGVEILMGASKVGALGSPTSFTFASGTSFSGPQVAGAAALLRDALAAPGLAPSQVRAALMNGTTNLRLADQTSVPDSDPLNFIHETGAGLVDLVRATRVRAFLGTNALNGATGPDDPAHPDFLASHSFGERPWAGTQLPASDPRQQARVTVTLADLAGGGTYSLSVVDAGPPRSAPRPPTGEGTPGQGDVTARIDEPGFTLGLGQSSITVGANGRVTFDVSVAADGNTLALRCCAVTDIGLELPGGVRVLPVVRSLEATEFLWYVVATRSDGSEALRMPFSLRVVQGVPGGGAVGSAHGSGSIASGAGSAPFGFSAHGASGKIRFDDNNHGVELRGDVASLTLSADGRRASFAGPCTLAGGRSCQFNADVEDNAEPGKGADRFTLRWTANDGSTANADGFLERGNVQVRLIQ